jgi:transcriptional regulator GlxA family with amidase domain
MTQQRHVAILIFDDVEVLDFAGPFEVFNVAGEVVEPSPFYTYTVGLKSPIKARGQLSINPHYTVENCPRPDILLIPGGDGRRVAMHDPHTLEWVRQQADHAELLLTVCTGAFILGKAGLLGDLPVTTHHSRFDEFRATFPQNEIIEDERFVDNGKIITSGGISAGIDMSLHVVERLLGTEALIKVVTEMEYLWHHSGENGEAT